MQVCRCLLIRSFLSGPLSLPSKDKSILPAAFAMLEKINTLLKGGKDQITFMSELCQ